jgi:beta-lactamase class A
MSFWAYLLLIAALNCSPADLSRRLPEVAAAAHGHVGVATMLLETGEVASLNANDHFPMQSVYKFPIVMSVLHRIDQKQLRLNQQIRIEAKDFPSSQVHSPIRDKYLRTGATLPLSHLMRAAIVDSDGAASDRLLKIVTPGEVTQYMRELGVNDIMILNTEKEFSEDHTAQYRNWITPTAAVQLLRILHEGRSLSAASRNLLLSWMTATQTGVRRIRAGLPKGTKVADKTGTSGTDDGVTAATNDIAIVTLPNGRHAFIAIFVSDSKEDQAVREGVIAKLARTAWQCWTN